jgi:predicted ATP-grasp superfamily ATP-dependent carboligase
MRVTMQVEKLQAAKQRGNRKITVEQFIDGQLCSIVGVAYEGDLLASVVSERTHCHPEKGPGTARLYFDLPEVQTFAKRIIEETQYNGFFGMDFILERPSNLPYIIEWNTRFTPPGAVGKVCGVDLCSALHARMSGQQIPEMKVNEGLRFAHYPEEWVRDPHSPLIQSAPNDKPEDDPDLLAAFERYIEEQRTPTLDRRSLL